jgi:hypothetical protein
MRRVRLKIIGRLIVSISLVFCYTFKTEAQVNSTFEAALHFIQIGEIEEGILFVSAPEKFGYRPLGTDTAAYLKGKFYYQRKRISESIHNLVQVGHKSPFHKESTFFLAYQHAYLGDYVNAKESLRSIDDSDDNIEGHLKAYLQSGFSLLERDIVSYEEIIYDYDFSKFRVIAPSSEKLKALKGLIIEQKEKSALGAGLLSAIVPGLGHMYVGNIGRGAMTLVSTGIFGLQAWESHKRDGLKSVRFAIFGSLFSGFYIANIYGSVIGVRLKKQQINDQINESILVTMHVPLRYLFD